MADSARAVTTRILADARRDDVALPLLSRAAGVYQRLGDGDRARALHQELAGLDGRQATEAVRSRVLEGLRVDDGTGPH